MVWPVVAGPTVSIARDAGRQINGITHEKLVFLAVITMIAHQPAMARKMTIQVTNAEDTSPEAVQQQALKRIEGNCTNVFHGTTVPGSVKYQSITDKGADADIEIRYRVSAEMKCEVVKAK